MLTFQRWEVAFLSCSEQATNKLKAEMSVSQRDKSSTTWILLKTVLMFEFHIIKNGSVSFTRC